MKRKVCHIVSDLNYSYFFEAIEKFSDKEKYELSFVFLNPDTSKLFSKFEKRGNRVAQVRYNGRKDLISAVLQLRGIFSEFKPDIVHTHLVDASLAGLIAARLSGIKNRVHTRHHSTEAHTFYPHGVYYDKVVNRLSKRIMAITTVVKEALIELENVSPDKIDLINYGYDFADFETDANTIAGLQSKYDLSQNFPVVGTISRFVEWKGVQYVIPAFAELTKMYPKAKLVLANAVGSYSSEIQSLLNKLLRPSQYVLIEYEPLVFNLYKCFDMFVHAPINRDFEAFGQVFIEPLYAKVPSIFTISGIANDFIRDRENAVVVPYKNSEAIFAAMNLLLTDKALVASMVEQGKKDVEARFHVSRLINDLDDFYGKLS